MWLATLILCTALGADAPSYTIEQIVFEHDGRISETILRSELGLNAPATLSESDLRNGQHRIRRLPFVLDADLSLKKGSKRGLYVLLITVEEAPRGTWLILSTPLQLTADDVFEGGDTTLSPPIPIPLYSWRWPIGRKALLQYTTPGFLNYGRFGIAERGVFSAGLSFPGNATPSTIPESGRATIPEIDFDAWRLDTSFDWRIRGDHWMAVSAAQMQGTASKLLIAGADDQEFDAQIKQARYQLTWRRNTLDHSIFTTSGSLLSMAIAREDEVRERFGQLEADNQSKLARFNSRIFRPLGSQSYIQMGGELQARWNRFDSQSTDLNGEPLGNYRQDHIHLDMGWGRQWLQQRIWGFTGDIRLGLTGSVRRSLSEQEDLYPDPNFTRSSLGLALTARSPKLLMQFSLIYTSTPTELYP